MKQNILNISFLLFGKYLSDVLRVLWNSIESIKSRSYRRKSSRRGICSRIVKNSNGDGKIAIALKA